LKTSYTTYDDKIHDFTDNSMFCVNPEVDKLLKINWQLKF